MEEAIETLRSLGAEIVDAVEIAHRQEVGRHEYEAMLYEFKAGLNAYLAELGDGVPVASLADVVAFNEANAEREMPFFGQEILIEAEGKGPLTEAAYRTARDTANRLSREEGLDATLSRHRLDAILGPSGGPAWVTDLVHGDTFSVGSSGAAAVAGIPERHGAGRPRPRTAGGRFLLRRRLERTDADSHRLGVRAGRPAPPAAAVPRAGVDEA